MLLSALAAVILTPRNHGQSGSADFLLKKTIPDRFGDWVALPDNGIVVSPEVSFELNQIYSQTFSRAYSDRAGNVVMLSIAYGENQTRDLQVHRPEVCYSAQGFKIEGEKKASILIDGGSLAVMRLLASKGSRQEPITYWVRIGDKLVRGNLEQGFARVAYGLSGQIVDGLLFRVSSIDGDASRAYATQERFTRDLLQALPPDRRKFIAGEYHTTPQK